MSSRALLPALVGALALAALPLRAQTPDSARAGIAGCTYDTCALRFEQGWFSTGVVRGAAGVRVARSGFLGYDLRDIVAGSDSASRWARVHRRDQGRAAVLGIVAGAAVVVALYDPDRYEDGNYRFPEEGWRIGTAAGGVVLGLVSTHFQMRAQRALARTIWWYNRELPR